MEMKFLVTLLLAVALGLILIIWLITNGNDITTLIGKIPFF